LAELFQIKKPAFIDLGANIGYWSCRCLSMYKVKKLIVVEPNPEILVNLKRNLELNGFTGEVIEKALTKESNKTVELHVDQKNVAGGSLLSTNRKEVVFNVQSVSLNDILKSTIDSEELIVVKMDIEGSELEVLKSSSNLGRQNVIYIYEDHGSDMNSKTTSYLLNTELYHVWLLRDNAQPLFISGLSILNQAKVSRKVGYNLLAIPKSSHLSMELKLDFD
jgi:FkbM family methyltransferase